MGEEGAANQAHPANECRDGRVQSALTGFIGVPCVDGHGDDGGGLGNRGQQIDVQGVGNTGGLDDRRYPERQSVKNRIERQQNQHQ